MSIRERHMNKCEKCSSPVPEEKAFCPNCGAPMVAERERTTETAEGMGETMYEAPPPMPLPLRKPTGPLPPPKPAKPAPSSKPSAAKSSVRNAAVSGVDYPKFAKKETPVVVDSNRTLQLILRASVVLFVLAILVVAILYVMGKI